MCVAICYSVENKHIMITHFTHTKAMLPVKTTFNQVQLVPWGRRKEEVGVLPLGGWLSKVSLEKGSFDHFFPKPVKIPVIKFMEYTVEDQPEWFDITNGYWIKGILLRDNHEQRVYTATLTPEMPNTPFSRWPIILAN